MRRDTTRVEFRTVVSPLWVTVPVAAAATCFLWVTLADDGGPDPLALVVGVALALWALLRIVRRVHSALAPAYVLDADGVRDRLRLRTTPWGDIEGVQAGAGSVELRLRDGRRRLLRAERRGDGEALAEAIHAMARRHGQQPRPVDPGREATEWRRSRPRARMAGRPAPMDHPDVRRDPATGSVAIHRRRGGLPLTVALLAVGAATVVLGLAEVEVVGRVETVAAGGIVAAVGVVRLVRRVNAMLGPVYVLDAEGIHHRPRGAVLAFWEEIDQLVAEDSRIVIELRGDATDRAMYADGVARRLEAAELLEIVTTVAREHGHRLETDVRSP